MKRWHDEYYRTYRQWREHWLIHVESNVRQSIPGKDPYQVDCPCDKQIGRFRKRKALDCGQPHCWACHSDKYPRRQLTCKERRAELNLKEQTQELD